MGVLVRYLALLTAFFVVLQLVLGEWPAPVEAHLGRRFPKGSIGQEKKEVAWKWVCADGVKG